MVIEREKESGRGGSGFSILFLAFFLSVITAKRRKKGKSEREGKRESGAVGLIFFPHFRCLFFVLASMASLARAPAAIPAPPLLYRTGRASLVRPSSIPRCLKAAIRSGRRASRLPIAIAAVERPSSASSISTTSTTSTSSSSAPSTPQQHPLDAEASQLRHALANRASADPLLLERARDLVLSLAAARRAATPEARGFLDALCGAVARGLEQSSSSSSSSISSLEATARLVKAYAQARHRTLATSELARASVKQACRALTATTGVSSSSSSSSSSSFSPPPPVPVFAAASSIARSVSCMGIYPGVRMLDALSSSAVAFAVQSSRNATDGSESETDNKNKNKNNVRLPSRLPASAVVDWLCAAAAAKHALPKSVSSLAATARFNPIQAAAAAAALASLGGSSGSSNFPTTLVSTLRSRVAGSPRGGVPPRAAVAAAWALASWGQLDLSSASALAEHAEAGVVVSVAGSESSSAAAAAAAPSPSSLRDDDLISLWGALRAAGWRAEAANAGEGGGGAKATEEEVVFVASSSSSTTTKVSARAARAAAAARAASVTAAAESNARGVPKEVSRLMKRLLKDGEGGEKAEARVLAPDADSGCLLWLVQAGRKKKEGDGDGYSAVALVALSPPDNVSSNSPVVPLGLAAVELNAAAAAAAAAEAAEAKRGDDSDAAAASDASAAFVFQGLLFDGDSDERQEALAIAVEQALRDSAGASPSLSDNCKF